MKRWWKNTHTETTELDAQLAADVREAASVRKMRAESQRLGERLDHHSQHNHFSERIIEGILSTKKGRPA
jgi:hypothetical protein